MICNSPMVLSVIDFPPALGPEITSMRLLASSVSVCDKVVFPFALLFLHRIGWKASINSMRVERTIPGKFA